MTKTVPGDPAWRDVPAHPGGDGDAGPDDRPIRAGRIAAWLVWIVGTAFVVFKFFNQSSYGILSFGVARTFELSLEQVGWLGSVYTLAYAVVTFFGGSLFDRYGGRRVLAVGASFIIAGATIFSTAQSWPALLVGQALMGVGGSFGFPGLAYLVREHFGALRFGIVFGLAQTVAAFAGAMLQQLAGLLIHTHSWREILLMQAAVGVPILLVVLFLVRPTEASARLREARGTTSLLPAVIRSVRGALNSRIVLEAALLSGVTFAAISGVGIVWGMRLLEWRGFEPTAANTICAMIWMGIGGGAPAIALLAKAMKSQLRAALVFSLGALLSIVAIALWGQGGMTPYIVLFFLYGFFGGGASMSGYTMAAEAADSSVVGSAFSIITFAGFALSGLLLPIPGYLLDHGVVATIEAAVWLYPTALALMIVSMVGFRWGADVG
jgi:MFS family permease